MARVDDSIDQVLELQRKSKKPLAVVLAGHNGSGKSTMWYRHLAPSLQMPLVNADRMMMSILPEVADPLDLPSWASRLRDNDTSWMAVAQQGVQAFVAHAMAQQVPFAMETVFSHWEPREDGTVDSKIQMIMDMKNAGYFTVLIFVGLTDSSLSIARVSTRVELGGHAVPTAKLTKRFPKTQKAIRAALTVPDVAILTDNSRDLERAFTVCRIQQSSQEIYDLRDSRKRTPQEISRWLDKVAPRST
jgi:predicted ABC-type ATPase